MFALEDNDDVAERELADPGALLRATELMDIFDPDAEARGAETDVLLGLAGGRTKGSGGADCCWGNCGWG